MGRTREERERGVDEDRRMEEVESVILRKGKVKGKKRRYSLS